MMGTRMTPDFWKVPSIVLRIYFTPELFNNKLPRWCTIYFPQKLEFVFFVNKDILLHNLNITIKIKMLALDCQSSDPIQVSPIVQIISRITKRFHSEPRVAFTCHVSGTVPWSVLYFHSFNTFEDYRLVILNKEP